MSDEPDERVVAVRTRYREILVTARDRQVFDYTWFPGEGTIEVYDAPDAVRLVVRFDADGLTWLREVFFDLDNEDADPMPILVVDTNTEFPPDGSQERTTIHRMYFDGERLLRIEYGIATAGIPDAQAVLPDQETYRGHQRFALNARSEALTWLAFARAGGGDFERFGG